MSDIISVDIDEAFPVAGQDNDSQGFRDNFSIIKNSLATARAEVTSLEELTAKKDRDNDFNNNEIQRAKFIQTTEKVISQATTVSMTLNWNYGSYQEVIVGADLSLTLASWPDSGSLGQMRVVVISDGLADWTVTFLSTLGNDIYKSPGFLNPFAVGSDKWPKVFDFWTKDGGDTVFGQFLGEFTPV
jgi:hypothetical protein